MSISAMKQALEALEGLWDDGFGGVPESMHKDAITALRQAIEQAEKQEPVAWMYEWGGNKHLTFVDQRFIEKAHPHFNKSTPLYTAPVHASDISAKRVDETEKDRHEFECPRCGHCCQQREWVGLTKDEVDSWELPDCPTVFEFCQFIEAKLKEKNT
jgi:hypothetical protein